MTYSYAIESMAIWDEALLLFRLNAAEVPPKHCAGFKFNPDRDKYQALADNAMLLIATVRYRGELVGYQFTLLLDSMHYEGVIQGISDCTYIHPNHRRGLVAKNLIEFVNECLHSLGVTVAINSVSTATKDWSPVLIRLGYEPQETTYVKRLEADNGGSGKSGL